jgi:hypothetical protein
MIKILLTNEEWELLKSLIPRVGIFDNLREKITNPADMVTIDLNLLEEAYTNGYDDGKEAGYELGLAAGKGDYIH